MARFTLNWSLKFVLKVATFGLDKALRRVRHCLIALSVIRVAGQVHPIHSGHAGAAHQHR